MMDHSPSYWRTTMTLILNGVAAASAVKEQLKQALSQTREKPHLVVVLVGHDPASEVYVKNKEKACHEVGFMSTVKRYEQTITQDQLFIELDKLNQDNDVHGIIVQLPLPSHINSQAIIDHISPKKDVDGFHPLNVGNLHRGQKSFVSATPLGILRLLEFYSIDVASKHVVVVGRSNIVGKPIAALLLNANSTVTVTHSKTKDLMHHTQQADILIVAAGIKHLINADHVKEGVVIVDVGIHRNDDGTLSGDVHPSANQKASAYSPVPKGVGPMTIAALLLNTYQAFQERG
jgi:methylenetetrahydrofolate dehydrogenase (NADP+)/methenyltetrahydrofolate cyclohydrolase